MPCRTPYLLLWTLALAACAGAPPLPVITVTPDGPFEWDRGRAMHHDSNRGVDFSAAFERDRGDYLEWWIRIDNHSERSLEVTPDDFYYRVAESEYLAHNVRAIDPARALAKLDAARASADAYEAEASKAYRGTDFLDDVVDGMLGFDPPSPSEARHARDQQRATYLAEREHQERWRELLANRTVRHSVLRPGESLEGVVLFPRLEHPGRTELILIVRPAIGRFRYEAGLRR